MKKFALTVIGLLSLAVIGFAQGSKKGVLSKNRIIFLDYFSEGEKFAIIGDTALAIENFKKALEINPESAAANYALAKIYASQYDYFTAFSFAERAVKSDNNNLYYKRLLAEIYYNQGSVSKAIKIYENDILPSSLYPADYYKLTDYYQSASRYRSALNVINRLRRVEGFTYENFFRALQLYSFMHDTAGMIAEYQKAIKTFPNSRELILSYANLLVLGGKVGLLKKFISENSGALSPGVLAYISSFYYLNTKKFDSAYFSIKRFLLSEDYTLQQVSSIFYTNKDFFTYENFGSYLDSLYGLVKTYVGYEPTVFSVFYNAFISHNYFYRAKNLLVYEIRNGYIEGKNAVYLAKFYLFFNEFDSLRAFLDTIFDYLPYNAVLWGFNAVYYLKTKDLKKAEQSIKKTEFYDASEPFLLFVKYLYYAVLNDNRLKEKYFRALKSVYSGNSEAFSYIAFYCGHLGIDTEFWKAELKSNCETDVSAENCFVLSYLYFRTKDYSQAKNYILKAISIDEKNKVHNFLYYELAYDIFLKINDLKTAEHYKTLALKYGSKLNFFKDEN